MTFASLTSHIHASRGYLPLADDAPADARRASDAARPVPASVTPMRPRGPTAAVQTIATAATDKSVPLRLKAGLARMRDNQRKAKQVGVDVARKSFWSKALAVGVAGLAVGGVVAAAVSTGGAALVAAAVIAGVVCAVSCADAGFAWQNWQNAKALARGESPPFDRPMGSSSLGHLFYRFYENVCGLPPARAKGAATVTDFLFRAGLAAAGSVCTLGLAASETAAENIIPLVGSAATMLQSLVDMRFNWRAAKTYPQSIEEMNEGFREIDRQLAKVKLPDEDRRRIQADLKEGRDRALSDVEKMRGMIPGKAAVGVSAAAGAVAATAAAALGAPASDFSAYRLFGSDMLSYSHTGGGAGGVSRRQ